mgnify:CR=1 FL=1
MGKQGATRCGHGEQRENGIDSAFAPCYDAWETNPCRREAGMCSFLNFAARGDGPPPNPDAHPLFHAANAPAFAGVRDTIKPSGRSARMGCLGSYPSNRRRSARAKIRPDARHARRGGLSGPVPKVAGPWKRDNRKEGRKEASNGSENRTGDPGQGVPNRTGG